MRRKAATGMLALMASTLALSGCLQPAEGLWGEPGPTLPEALIRSDPYPRLVVEVDHALGHAPCPQAVDAMMAALYALTDKQKIELVEEGAFSRQGGDYTNDGLAALHEATSGAAPSADFGHGDAAYLHVVFLDGQPAGTRGGHTAGRTLHDAGALFVFRDAYDGAYTIDRHLRRDATCDVERAVLLHELGHAFGLVNRGIPMLHDREADDHAGHSTNPASVMYPRLSLAPDGLLLQDLPRGFDRHDIRDIGGFRAA